MTPVRLEPAPPRSRVKHSTTEPLRIDPLTPYQGHQFDIRVNFFIVSWSTAHPLSFDMPLDHVQKIKFLNPSTPWARPRGPNENHV